MTSKGAGFVKADRQGNQIYAEGSNQGGSTVSELSQGDIKERNLNPEKDIVIEELGESGSTIREREPDEHVIKLETDSLANSRLSKFFSESEIETLQEKEETIEGESKPEDLESVWDGIRRDVKRHNKEVAKKRREQERQRIKEAFKDPALEKKMTQMTGEEIQRVMNSDGSPSQVDEEELEQALNKVDEKYASWLDEDSDTEINTPDSQVEELAANSWEDSENSAFQDIAEDIEKSDEQTLYESVGENSRRVTTKDPELKRALRNPEKEPFDGTVELEQDGETVIAVVTKED
jgi:hypothetical protein